MDDAEELEPPAPGRGKAEWTKDEANPRFVVTSLTRAECKARYLYEKVYCARGDMENRIKECQLDLYADRTSTATMRANQLRLWFASMAYVLLCALRRIALHHTPVRQSHLRHHPSQAAQDRRPRARQRPPHQGCDGVSVSGSRYLGLRCQASRRCRQRAGLARLTRAAATRNPRGITPRPTETTSSLPFAAGKSFQQLSRLLTPRRRASAKKQTSLHRKSARSCKDSVRYTG